VALAAALVLIGPGLALTIANDGGALGIGLLVLGGFLYLIFAVLYAPYFMQRSGSHNGQTLGKQWVGIRVARNDGQGIGWGTGLLRELVVKGLLVSVLSSIASAVTFFLLGLGSAIAVAAWYLWPLWDDENRAPHDMLVSTHVVRA
jgi:uncharacterized RDD family membrane protein YckC